MRQDSKAGNSTPGISTPAIGLSAVRLSLPPRMARVLSLLVGAGIVVGYPLGALLMAPDGTLPMLIMPLHLVGLVAALVLFFDGRGQMTADVTARLDERERALRDKAYVTTHLIMALLLFAACLWIKLARLVDGWMPGPAQAVELLTAFVLLFMAMPGMILAWREQPADAEDEA